MGNKGDSERLMSKPDCKFLGRNLTEQEQSFHDEERCIACGARVESVWRYGKSVIPFECKDCWRARTNTPTRGRRDYGPARASIFHSAVKELGYGPASGSGPEMRGDGDDW